MVANVTADWGEWDPPCNNLQASHSDLIYKNTDIVIIRQFACGKLGIAKIMIVIKHFPPLPSPTHHSVGERHSHTP